MEAQSTALSPEAGQKNGISLAAIKSLLDCVDKGLLVAERSGRIVLANLRGRECLASLGHADYRDANLISDVLEASPEAFLQKIEAGSREIQLEIVSGTNKFLATAQWIAEQEWLLLQFEQAVANRPANAETQLTVQELLQEREITYRNLLAA